jgi:hypothetical protein
VRETPHAFAAADLVHILLVVDPIVENYDGSM